MAARPPRFIAYRRLIVLARVLQWSPLVVIPTLLGMVFAEWLSPQWADSDGSSLSAAFSMRRAFAPVGLLRDDFVRRPKLGVFVVYDAVDGLSGTTQTERRRDRSDLHILLAHTTRRCQVHARGDFPIDAARPKGFRRIQHLNPEAGSSRSKTRSSGGTGIGSKGSLFSTRRKSWPHSKA